ncbi:alpha/beta fold hydrolase [Actinomadura sp. ATCC 31491]|uniref:Alpha/beta fold hydrolase n=1 Tax=Actinomadura luzonensis TaxID=2805427 RepID=A0ABT0G204_9ACTN|nr:alpha/beta fold hydrolase [Actinomadura luzonensis]MCK2218642.1 alpha/beta fold hydrolase [Actinomadura luzonensis]
MSTEMTVTDHRRAPERLRVSFTDGSASELVVFRAARPDAPVVLCLPAMGVRAAYYTAVAAALAARGHTAVLADLRGNGGSSVRPSRSTTFGYAEMLDIELPEIVAALRAELGAERVTLFGHSLGGHLSVLHAAVSPHVAATVLVATGTSWYGRVPGLRRPARFLGLQVIRLVTALYGYLPGWLPFAGVEARGVVRDWLHDALHGAYLVHGSPVDYEAALSRSTVPALFVVLPGDHYVPEACSRQLADRLPAARVSWAEIPADQVGLARTHHFRWAHRPGAVVEAALRWLEPLNPEVTS